MRVFELAKSMQTSSVEVLKQADALGIEAYSPLSALEDQEVSRLQAYFAGLGAEVKERASAERAERARAKQERARSRRMAQSQADRAVLEANRARALEMDVRARGEVSPEPAAPAPAAEAETTPPSTAAPEKPAPAPQKKTTPATAATARPTSAVKPTAAKPAAAKPTAQKTKPARYASAEDELEPEEQLAASFMQRIAKEPEREMSKPPRMTPEGKTREKEKEIGRIPQRPASAASAAARPGSRPSRFTPVSQQRMESGTPPDRIILLRGAVVVKELAEKLGIRANRLIADLMQLNILASINQRVEVDVAQKVADKYGFKVEIEKAKRSTERRPVLRSEDADDTIPDDKPEDLLPRPPVVTFLGHVDHGKTSLMDRIRNTRVTSGEAGGITQHIGAYTVEINGRKITFLDTPGHAAFSAMRARGASLTDIAVIIIAADDGIMPQTREAIRHAQQAGVQIMIAINKCDLPTAKPDRVRQMLQSEGLTPEEWGGDIISVEVSAMTGKGVDHLLEMILLQADMLELSANPARRADGFVVEAQLEQGLGPTATLLIAGGTLNVGDAILCGEHFGKIRGLIDDRGRRVKSAGPATAVKCMGLSGVPEAGAAFRVMLNEKRARELAEKLAQERKEIELSSAKATSLDALMSQMQENQRRELALIVKADTQGSSEAVCEALREIKSEKVTLNIIHEAIGNVSATDVNKAAAGRALIVGFSVGCDAGVQQLARHAGVRINTFRIIYELLEFVKQRMLDLLPPEYKEVIRGHAEIRAIFDIGKTGRVAGCQMLDGVIRADARCRIFRKKEQIWDGRFAALKHFQDDVSEVTGSQECGIFFDGFEAFQEGDTVECYVLEELPRSL
ncbi:MAG TPA: translation initiation factor IF-2 [Kiritimatiellia bacterium]|jgi:translation initiation factor IF-2|nr:translation initiation factor IF-2 [Kiritimatiellia bacterium]HOR97339.1 translation initiation factor IF-2 [Kiritimatiellia bacterium]HPK37745.1 translation initiation factor IF-2 [Kiritimatiellia bacterium]HPW75127.1 translation initiation factor IF-2 [Kiritimatiellia bacterium]